MHLNPNTSKYKSTIEICNYKLFVSNKYEEANYQIKYAIIVKCLTDSKLNYNSILKKMLI